MFSWRTCFHEISHALVARALGVAVVHANVNRDDSGATRLDWQFDGQFDWHVPLVITLAGTIGERLLAGGGEFHDHEIVRARSWIEAIHDLAPGSLQCVVGREPEFKSAVQRAEKLLRAQLSVVRQLARILEREGRVSGERIGEIASSRDPRGLRARLNLQLGCA